MRPGGRRAALLLACSSLVGQGAPAPLIPVAAPCPHVDALRNGTRAVVVSWDHEPRSLRLTAEFVRGWPVGPIDIDGVEAQDASAWVAYLRSVYGTSDGGKAPRRIDVSSLAWFWWWAPGAAHVQRVPTFAWRRARAGDAWVQGDKREAAMAFAGFFLEPAVGAERAASGLPDFSALEVLRVRTAPGEMSRHLVTEAGSLGQVWYWAAPGSGIALELGRTLALRDRAALYKWLVHAAARLDALTGAERAERLARMRRDDLRPSFARDPSAHAPGAMSAAIAALQLIVLRPPAGARYRAVCHGCAEPESAPGLSPFDVLRPPSRGSRHLQLCDLPRAFGFETVQLTRAFGHRHEVVDCRAPPRDAAHARGRAALPPHAAWDMSCPPTHSRMHLRRGPTRIGPGTRGRACECASAVAVLNCGVCAVPLPAGIVRANSSRPSGRFRLGDNVGGGEGGAMLVRAQHADGTEIREFRGSAKRRDRPRM
ncbi:hypothetical protein KFE25_002060 [Diacronema lutheri]|uniref:Uncharacterized protein n=1 Tax=Diacronema lutheri TaxID=2081491 RepID=A0A8J5XMQ8_DIALT|nr:hypothetical protein KFE25_002060 [Diacronema lutheri]